MIKAQAHNRQSESCILALFAGYRSAAYLCHAFKIIKRGFVEKPEDYLYSGAGNYYGMKGLIDIDTLDPLIVFV
jgi:hypothetical protein